MKRGHAALAKQFVENLSSVRFDGAFNPYADRCPEHDKRDAPHIRCQNLEAVLVGAMKNGAPSLWIARDLGYKGGRRTGLALTDEVHLHPHSMLHQTAPLRRATRGPEVAERTATIVWGVLASLNQPVFLWNVFPLHPFAEHDPMSNRCHTREERRACAPFLLWLVEVLKPKTVVAIGADASRALDELGICATAIRHPSYGGQSDFLKGISKLYNA